MDPNEMWVWEPPDPEYRVFGSVLAGTREPLELLQYPALLEWRVRYLLESESQKRARGLVLDGLPPSELDLVTVRPMENWPVLLVQYSPVVQNLISETVSGVEWPVSLVRNRPARQRVLSVSLSRWLASLHQMDDIR